MGNSKSAEESDYDSDASEDSLNRRRGRNQRQNTDMEGSRGTITSQDSDGSMDSEMSTDSQGGKRGKREHKDYKTITAAYLDQKTPKRVMPSIDIFIHQAACQGDNNALRHIFGHDQNLEYIDVPGKQFPGQFHTIDLHNICCEPRTIGKLQ